MRDEKGIALMITLWVLVLVSIITLSFALFTRYESAGTRNFKESQEAYYAAISAYEDIVGYLLTDKDPAVDFIDENGIYWADTERPTPAGHRTSGNVELEIDISDEESRLNINTASEDILRRLFLNRGIPEKEIDSLIDSLSDWKDSDDLVRLSGAENEYYESLTPSYKAKNEPFSSTEEILLIKGFKPEYLYGKEGIEGLYKYISVYPSALNINTSPREIFEALGLPEADIDAIFKQRTKELGGLRTIHPFSSVALTTASTTLRVEITASTNGKQVFKLLTLLKKTLGTRGTELKNIYWKESIEGSRA